MGKLIRVPFRERRDNFIKMEEKRKADFKKECFSSIIDFMMDERNPWAGEVEKKKLLLECQEYIEKIYKDEVSHHSYCPF